jgi:hypothetical protein
MRRGFASLEKAHPAFAAGDKKRIEVKFRSKLLGSPVEIDFIGWLARDGEKLSGIRRNDIGTSISFEIASLWVDESLHALCSTPLEQNPYFSERTLSII